MLNKWRLGNFKSVRAETELEMAPLTIFAGANSSGKSTFLQSILLVTQTLSHKVSSRSVVLNGSIAKLGQFDDLKSIDSESDQIVIGWTSTPPKEAFEDFGAGFRRMPLFMPRGKETLSEISCRVSFDADDSEIQREVAQIQPILCESELSATTTDPETGDRKYFVNIRRSKDSGASKQRWLNPNKENDPLSVRSLRYNISLDDESVADLREDLVSAQAIGCILRHFLPERIALGVDMVTEDAQSIINILIGEGPRGMPRRYVFDRDITVPQKIVDLLLNSVRNIETNDTESILARIERHLDQGPNLFGPQPVFLEKLYDALRSLHPRHRMEIRRILSEDDGFEKYVREAVRAERQEQLDIILSRPPRAISAACWYSDQFFSSFLKYLGPLRDEPKPQYPLSPTTDPSDVGLKGEHTAAVLELHKNHPIRYIPTSAFADAEIKSEPTTRSLESAVVDWLQYLGVAEGIESKDKGKFGHELTVRIAGTKRPHDLTHVGVGVSQVLPILVTSLLSDHDTTLVFEQPELHLHPMVQTRLADFFLSIVLMGKQCLVETHSEYLINRIRYRAASEENTSRVTDNLKMYFVEKMDGSSIFREVRVNEYGAILEWPEGFFDQSTQEAEDILRSAMKKRRAERRKGAEK